MALLRRAIACQSPEAKSTPKLARVESAVPGAIASPADAFLADFPVRGLVIRLSRLVRGHPGREVLLRCARENNSDPAQLTPAFVGSDTSGLL